MYGLGKGVYLKGKISLVPFHPHCMCRLEEVFTWEVDISKQKNNVKQAGNKWLAGISDENRRLVLGIEGNAMWKEGENWQKYMRNWKGLAEPETRLKESIESSKVKLPDIQVHKSVGAKVKNYDVLDPATGEICRFIE
jgi:hypothetical protein